MAGLARTAFVLVGLIAVLLSLPVVRRTAGLVRLGLGIGKVIQPASDFPYRCRRLHDPRLQACEDLWLSAATRRLFLACSDPEARSRWGPNEGNFDLAGRSVRDAVVVMDPATLAFRALPVRGFAGTGGDGVLNVVGFAGADGPGGAVELLLTNLRPSADPSTGRVLADQAAAGANATIETFRVAGGPAAEALEWVATRADPLIATPNRPAVVEGRGVYITNDHGQRKTGMMSMLSPILSTGDVVFCSLDRSLPCEMASAGHSYPNGLLHSRVDQLIYVPSSAAGGVKVFKRRPDDSLELVHDIDLPYAIDNLSEDQDGDIWAAVIPRGVDFFRHTNSPFAFTPPSSVFRIRRGRNGTFDAKVEKVLEDRDGEVLPGTTTVVHDATTGRLFLGGGFSPFITVCETTR